MSDELAVVALRCGRFRLVLGSEVGITAMEVVTAEDQTRLDVGELRGTTHQLDAHGGSRYPEAVFIVDKNDDERRGEMAGEVEVDTYGSDDGSVKIALRELHPYIRKGILAEAAFAAWQQRLADAADSLNQLTSEDAKIVGPLDVPGRPLITELRADRRRASRSAAVLLGPIGAIEACVDDLIADLRASVRFGAAGFAEAADVHLGEAVQSASDYGGWVDRLRLLIAAEEICAIELLASTERALASDGADDSDSDIVDQLLAKYWSQRQQAEELAALLDDVVDRLPTAPVNPAKRFVRRKALRDVQVLSATAAAYSGVVSPASSPKPDATSWDEAARTLVKLDVVTAAAESRGGGARFDERAAQSIEDAAGWLGELFAQQLQAARTLVDDLARQHPGVDTEGRVQMVKRQAMRKLASGSRRDDSQQPVEETVAVLAMAIALLRGIEPHTESEYEEMGRRILAKVAKIANFQTQAGARLPLAFAGLERFARYVQPAVAEFFEPHHQRARLVVRRRLVRRRGFALSARGLALAAFGWGPLAGGTVGAGIILLSLLMATKPLFPREKAIALSPSSHQ
jgi:hypothetical protein